MSKLVPWFGRQYDLGLGSSLGHHVDITKVIFFTLHILILFLSTWYIWIWTMYKQTWFSTRARVILKMSADHTAFFFFFAQLWHHWKGWTPQQYKNKLGPTIVEKWVCAFVCKVRHLNCCPTYPNKSHHIILHYNRFREQGWGAHTRAWSSQLPHLPLSYWHTHATKER